MVLSLAAPSDAQEAQRPPQPSPRREEPAPRPAPRPPEVNVVGRSNALARLSMTGKLYAEVPEPRGPDLESVWRSRAREDLMALANGLQQLYDLGDTRERGEEFRKRVESGTGGPTQAVRRVLEFFNRGTEPPEVAPIDLPDEGFDLRVLRLVETYVSVLDPTAELILGDVLDLETLDQVREGLSEIEALLLALPASVP